MSYRVLSWLSNPVKRLSLGHSLAKLLGVAPISPKCQFDAVPDTLWSPISPSRGDQEPLFFALSVVWGIYYRSNKNSSPVA